MVVPSNQRVAVVESHIRPAGVISNNTSAINIVTRIHENQRPSFRPKKEGKAGHQLNGSRQRRGIRDKGGGSGEQVQLHRKEEEKKESKNKHQVRANVFGVRMEVIRSNIIFNWAESNSKQIKQNTARTKREQNE